MATPLTPWPIQSAISVRWASSVETVLAARFGVPNAAAITASSGNADVGSSQPSRATRRADAGPCTCRERFRGRSRRGVTGRAPVDTGTSRFSCVPPPPPREPKIPQRHEWPVRFEMSVLPRVAPICRKPAGSYTPKNAWRLNAGNPLAPIRRKLNGSYVPEDDTVRTPRDIAPLEPRSSLLALSGG